MDLTAKIIEVYAAGMKNDKAIAAIRKKVSENTATYKEAGTFADRSGRIMGNAIISAATTTNDDDEWEFLEAPADIVPGALLTNYNSVASITRRIQQAQNEKVGIGLNAVTPTMDAERAAELVEGIEQGMSKEQFLINVVNTSRKVVDDFAKENAAAQSRAGLIVLVTREYDDVGVHNGKDVCEWCMERCGTDMTYSEAYDKGAFERHPGCGCVITYTSRKGTTTQQTRAGGNWEEVSERNIDARKRHGL